MRCQLDFLVGFSFLFRRQAADYLWGCPKLQIYHILICKILNDLLCNLCHYLWRVHDLVNDIKQLEALRQRTSTYTHFPHHSDRSTQGFAWVFAAFLDVHTKIGCMTHQALVQPQALDPRHALLQVSWTSTLDKWPQWKKFSGIDVLSYLPLILSHTCTHGRSYKY